jgi:hypothetical protein
MQFLVLIKATKEDMEAAKEPTSELLEEMGKFNEGLAKDGMLRAMNGLPPGSKSTRLRFDGGRPTVTDGPFAETKELVAGFWVVDCKSHEEAVERFTHLPSDDGTVIEILGVPELDDFGEEFAAAIREHRKSLGL